MLNGWRGVAVGESVGVSAEGTADGGTWDGSSTAVAVGEGTGSGEGEGDVSGVLPVPIVALGSIGTAVLPISDLPWLEGLLEHAASKNTTKMFKIKILFLCISVFRLYPRQFNRE